MPIDSRVSMIMTKDVVSVAPDTPVEEVARLMWEHNLSTLPVIEDGLLAGILTDFDLVARETEYDAPMFIPFLDSYFQLPGSGDSREQLRRILATTARELMTSAVVTVNSTDTVQDVATVMYDQHLNAVPVVDAANKMVGIVSRADIIRLMVSDETNYELTHPETD